RPLRVPPVGARPARSRRSARPPRRAGGGDRASAGHRGCRRWAEVSSTTDNAAGLRRLLAVLAWLAQVGEASIDEVASRFDLTPQALVTELEMAACCGVPPYTPDQLMEIIVTDHTVSTRVGTALTRPRRLSPSEGFALAASARALLAVEGSADNNALTGALAKLERALGGEA